MRAKTETSTRPSTTAALTVREAIPERELGLASYRPTTTTDGWWIWLFSPSVALSVFTVLSSAAAWAGYRWYYQQQQHDRRHRHEGTTSPSNYRSFAPPHEKRYPSSRPSDSSPSPTPTPNNNDQKKKDEHEEDQAQLVREFHDVCQRMKQQVPASQVSPEQSLQWYAWYKQATAGDAPETFALISPWTTVPGMTGVAQAKWMAWNQCRGLSPATAMRRYLQSVQEGGWISTGGSTAASSSHSSFSSSSSLSNPRPDHAAAFPMGGGMGVTVSTMLVTEDDEEKEDRSPDATVTRQFLEAARGNDIERLQQLWESGQVASIHQADPTGQTALHMAADQGALDALQWLCQHGAQVSTADHHGISVLQAAVIAGHAPTCRWLLQHGADPDQPDLDGDTPRHCAQDEDSAEIQALFDAY